MPKPLTLTEIYQSMTPSVESEITAFQQKSYAMVKEFRANTTNQDDLDKLNMIEQKIHMRVEEVRRLCENLKLNLHRLSMGLHLSEITEAMEEESLKKKSPGKASQPKHALTEPERS